MAIVCLMYNFSVQLRRERIAERIRALQELVPSVNKVSSTPFMSCFVFSFTRNMLFYVCV